MFPVKSARVKLLAETNHTFEIYLLPIFYNNGAEMCSLMQLVSLYCTTNLKLPDNNFH